MKNKYGNMMYYEEYNNSDIINQELEDEESKIINYQLDQMQREYFLNWAKEFNDNNFFMSCYSSITGRWDDLKKDIARNKITFDQVNIIIDKLLSLKLINITIADYQKNNILYKK